MRHLVTIVAVVLVGAGIERSVSATPPAVSARPASAAELKVWLEQLDDESYSRREQATDRLHAAGEQAIDVLAQGALSSSPEAAWRAGEALKRIAITGNEQTIDRVATALERVGKQGRAGVVQVVGEIRARQRQMRHDRAAAQIRRLGGGLSGGIAEFAGGGAMMVDVGFLPGPVIIEEEELLVPAVEEAKEVAAAEVKEAAAEAAVVAELAAKAASIEAEKAAADAVKAIEGAAKEAAPEEGVPATEVGPPKEKLVKPAERAELKFELEGLALTELSLELGEGQKVEEGAVEDDAALDEFRKLERLPLDAEEPVAAPEPVVVDDLDVGIEAFAVGGFFMAGGGFGDIDVEEGMRAEGLSLDANWRGGDKGLEVLRDLPEITSINIHGAQLGDEALAHIAALPRLTNLSIRGTKFSVAALRKLHAARPRAYLFCQGEAMVGIHADTAGSCVLTSVYGGSGAADAGLREGDRIVSIDGVEIRDFSELTISVYGHGVGEKLKIEYERDGKRQTAQVELKARAVLEP
jgi:vacuolar-type H+-ATPase subunit H